MFDLMYRSIRRNVRENVDSRQYTTRDAKNRVLHYLSLQHKFLKYHSEHYLLLTKGLKPYRCRLFPVAWLLLASVCRDSAVAFIFSCCISPTVHIFLPHTLPPPSTPPLLVSSSSSLLLFSLFYSHPFMCWGLNDDSQSLSVSTLKLRGITHHFLLVL